jgi:hypothetical protein
MIMAVATTSTGIVMAQLSDDISHMSGNGSTLVTHTSSSTQLQNPTPDPRIERSNA